MTGESRPHGFHPFTLEGLEETIQSLKGKKVYVTVDLEVMDPSVFREPVRRSGGISFLELMRGVTQVCRELEIIGCDVTNSVRPAIPRAF